MTPWLATPPGQLLLAWEREQLARAVGDVFGFHALQLGLPQLDALAANRMPHRWLAVSQATAPEGVRPALVCDFSALPFPANSLDLVVMPHTLELSVDPHGTLREVERVLVPEGRVVICGFNPVSLWGLRQKRAHVLRRLGVGELYLPEAGEFLGALRLRDWLRLLNFDLAPTRFGVYRPALRSQVWLQRTAPLDTVGARWWPFLGALYVQDAIKRVRGMTLLNPGWKPARRRAAAPVAVANRRPSPPARSASGPTILP
ncbi:MAG: class I SAM-dependent methyltransferase [Rhodoferax sp.]